MRAHCEPANEPPPTDQSQHSCTHTRALKLCTLTEKRAQTQTSNDGSAWRRRKKYIYFFVCLCILFILFRYWLLSVECFVLRNQNVAIRRALCEVIPVLDNAEIIEHVVKKLIVWIIWKILYGTHDNIIV